MIDAREVADRLAARVESVCAFLLPGGKRIGNEWVYDPGHGKIKVEMRQSAKIGKWSHFGGDGSGDLLDLWAHQKGVDAKEAFKQACQWLGVENPTFKGSTDKKSYKRPARPPETKKAKKGTEAAYYLMGERGLFESTLEAFKIVEAEVMRGKNERGEYTIPGPWILFPCFRSEGDGKTLANIKWLHVARDQDGKKRTKQESGAEPTLFGWQAVPPSAKEIVLTEGEIDAMTVFQWGYPALSLPQGAGTGAKQNWIETEWDNLARFETIYLCMDNDEEGEKTIPELVKRLGSHRCRIVRLPHKDANECLAQHGLMREHIAVYFETAAYIEPDELKSASSFADVVVDKFYPRSDTAMGIPLPWAKADKFRLRMGEVTLWTGINGHGKSELIGQIALGACDRDYRVCEFSGELKADELLARKVQQLAMQEKPHVEHIRSLMDWFEGRYWLYNVKGRTDRQRLLEVFRYARRRYRIDLFIIDSLMRCGIAEDDYNAQGDFMDELVSFAADEGCHVILVVHPSKAQDETRPVGKLRMKGTGKLTDLAHNCVETWRNKPKEKKRAEIESNAGLSEIERADKLADLRNKADTKVIIDKQRVTGWEGTINLWYVPHSRSWADNRSGDVPIYTSTPKEIDEEVAF